MCDFGMLNSSTSLCGCEIYSFRIVREGTNSLSFGLALNDDPGSDMGLAETLFNDFYTRILLHLELISRVL